LRVTEPEISHGRKVPMMVSVSPTSRTSTAAVRITGTPAGAAGQWARAVVGFGEGDGTLPESACGCRRAGQ